VIIKGVYCIISLPFGEGRGGWGINVFSFFEIGVHINHIV